MTESRTIVHKTIMVAALGIAVASLPFSVKVCHAAIMIIIINWLFEGQWHSKLSVVRNSLLLQVIIGLFAIQILGLAFSDNILRGWFSLEKKIFLFFLPVALATTVIRLKRRELNLILICFLIACLAGTVLCVQHAWREAILFTEGKAEINPYLAASQYYDLYPVHSEKWVFFSYVSLSEGISIHPTYFSIYLAFSILILLHEFPHLPSRLIRAVAMILIIYFAVFVVFLSSRIVILALAMGLLFVLIRGALSKQKSLAIIAALIAVIFSFLLFLNPVTRYRSLQDVNVSTFQIEPGNDYSSAAQIRVSLWWLAFKSLANSNILFGAGTGDVEKAMARTSVHYRITNIIHSFDPHNQYLYTLLGNGFAAFSLLVLALILPVYYAYMQSHYLPLGFSLLFALLCFTESALELQKGIAFYSIFSGLLFFQLNTFQNFSIKFRSLSGANR